MKKYVVGISILCLLLAAVYGIDHGVFVGTNVHIWGPPPALPEEGNLVVKTCRYLFITGVTEIPAHDGISTDAKAPYRGYCPLLAN